MVDFYLSWELNIKTCNALSAGTILNAAICTIHSKHETSFIFNIFLMFGYIDLKMNDLEFAFFQIESKSLLDEMLLKSFAIDFYNYVFMLIVTFLFNAYLKKLDLDKKGFLAKIKV